MTAAQSETLAVGTLLAAVREGLAKPFADPVCVRELEFTRAEARAAERVLSRVLLSPSCPLSQEPATGGAGAVCRPQTAAAPVFDHSFHGGCFVE